MKIFASNFALDLQLLPDHDHFGFERSTMEEIALSLQKKPWFPGQVKYLDYRPELFGEVVSLLQNEAIARRRAIVILYFPEAKTRKKFFKKLIAEFKEDPAAGGLVRNENEELLLIKRHGHWDIPKGKLDKGEAPNTAALREVEEETHLSGHQITDDAPILTYHTYLRKGKWRFKQTNWYRMKVASGDQNLSPQLNEGITEVRWWSMPELDGELPPTYPQIEELIRRYRFGE